MRNMHKMMDIFKIRNRRLQTSADFSDSVDFLFDLVLLQFILLFNVVLLV